MPAALSIPSPACLRPMLGRDWSGEDVTGWLMSEKLDGVRALWDPASGQLLSRSGRPFAAPAWWLAGLPDVPLDGELYLGRGRFEEVRAIVQSSVRGGRPEAWRDVRLHVFDLPASDLPAARRVERRQLGGGHVELVRHEICRGRDHLLSVLDEVTAAGGEGLMLLEPDSHYEPGRTWSLLKVKQGISEKAAELAGFEPRLVTD